MSQINNATAPQNLIIYHTDDGRAAVALYARDGDVWMNQNQLAELFATSKQNISLHIANILKEKELSAEAVVKDYLTTAIDGKKHNTKHHNLNAFVPVGYKVNSERGEQ